MIDALVLRLATRRYGLFGPVVSYQDLPWSGVTGARRAAGSEGRLREMQRHLDSCNVSPNVVLDIGCNIGYFALSFVQRGALVYGVESDALALRVATISSVHLDRTRGTFSALPLACTPTSVHKLPCADITICLSIWHHWVRYQGLEAATSMMQSLWDRTGAALYFDSGENEMPSVYNLPFQNEAATPWLAKYLETNLENARVEQLGRFAAFAPGGRESTDKVFRTLFAVTRAARFGDEKASSLAHA